jgi:type I restriction enzyme, S subunit
MQLLEKHFDLAFSAPSGVQKLRGLILTFAMQGKLVPQDQNDQPASELLKEIEAEKQRLLKQGEIKQNQPLPQIKQKEMAYELPKGWEWVRLGEITNYNGRRNANSEEIAPNTWLLDLEDIEKDTSRVIYRAKYSERQSKSTKSTFNAGDVLYGKLRPYLNKVVVADADGVCTTEIVPIVPFNGIDSQFLRWLLKRPSFLSYVDSLMYGVKMPRLGTDDAIMSVHPLPPFAEQKRIVARIDRLMAQCDELENLGGDRNQKRIIVHAAAINRLLAAQENSDFSTAWDFIQQHFSQLYSVKENVAELRKAILQLAVMGKLVPQDPNDEPASELLKAIELEKQQLVEEGEIRQPKPLPQIKLEDIPYRLPEQWEWIRLGAVVISSHAGRSPQCLSRQRIRDEWGVLKVSAVSWGAFNPDENKALPPEMQPRPADEVKAGDFLLSRANTEELVARSVVVTHTPPNLMISDKTIRLILSERVDKQFINIANLSNSARTYYARNASGTSSSMKNVSREVMYELPVPLPPLVEQRRIIAKVDQFMALCDRLEQQIDAATNKRTELLNALTAQV